MQRADAEFHTCVFGDFQSTFTKAKPPGIGPNIQFVNDRIDSVKFDAVGESQNNVSHNFAVT
jgi:hypothetical protein